MEKRNRLTETLSHYINGNPCEPYGHCLADCTTQMSFINPSRKHSGCGDCQHFEKVLTRLADFEDKLEDNRMIELPCKVGDPVFYVNKAEGLVHEYTVSRLVVEIADYDRWELNQIYFVDKETGKNKNGFNNYFYFKWIGDRVFFDIEKARERLKEIKDEGL